VTANAKAPEFGTPGALTPGALARILDHSVLKPEASEADVRHGAALVERLRIGFYCVQSAYVPLAVSLLRDVDARVAAVIGFPHGCERTPAKAVEAQLAIDDGARELDMVLHVGALKSGAHAAVQADIAAVVRAAPGIPVKVILETAALSDDEKRIACRLARDAGAAFVKTSTGFHPAGGATAADVRLMRAEVGPNFGVKASGGIRTLADVRTMIEAGANRIGTSASEAILAALLQSG
jgi:deoxyribose-phosphate aldolase